MDRKAGREMNVQNRTRTSSEEESRRTASDGQIVTVTDNGEMLSYGTKAEAGEDVVQ